MSLAIDTNSICEVLLNDGWHRVKRGTFNVDAYEFFEGDFYSKCDYSVTPPLWVSPPCKTGFEFTEVHMEDEETILGVISGPMTSILAINKVV